MSNEMIMDLTCPACGTAILAPAALAPCANLACPNQYAAVWAAATVESRRLAGKLDEDLEAADDQLYARWLKLIRAFSDAARSAGSGYRYAMTVDQSGRGTLQKSHERWVQRRNARLRQLELERLAALRSKWRRCTVGSADITEHVAAMFDALIGSADWGSGFLDTETIESILIVGEVAGFDLDAATTTTGTASWRDQIRAKAAAMLRGDGK